MYDAAHVRFQAGRHAALLNVLVKHHRASLHKANGEAVAANGNGGRGEGEQLTEDDERLKELLGHTEPQVYAGALLGIVVAFLVRTP